LGSCPQAVCNPDISTSDNRFTSAGWDYDEAGNVLEDAGGKQFTYDAENHQIEVKDDEETVLGQYFYDGEGRRVKKIAGSETTVFVYNASGQLVAEYSTQTSSTPQVSYLTTDHLGSTRRVTDQLGAVKDRKDFGAFGDETATAARVNGLGYNTADPTRKGYTGYEKDGESSLEFAQARYYSTTHGRYTSVYPLTASASIRNPQTFNRYTYVLNSPYKYTDPLGLLPLGSRSCGQWCTPGEFVDGTAFRGSDTSQAWTRPLPDPPPPAEQNADSSVGGVVAQTDVFKVEGALSRFGDFRSRKFPSTTEC
jgi:RHS repeat-associated protein